LQVALAVVLRRGKKLKDAEGLYREALAVLDVPDGEPRAIATTQVGPSVV
jgi:hypothetical protein